MMMNCTELICPLQARQLFTFWASSNIFTLLIVGMVSFISFRTGLISVHVVCCDAQNEKRFYTEDTLLYTLYDGWFSWYLLAFWARSIGCFVTYFLGVWSWANCFSFFFGTQEAAETLLLLNKSQLPIPALILSEDQYESKCSLIGCSLSINKPLNYCSTSHKHMAKMMSSQHVPIKCLGDFSSTNERDRLCGCILIDKSKQVDTGVPDLINPQFFSTVPIHLPFIKENPPASSASTQYMFFHSPPPPPYQSIQWTPEEYTRDFQVGSYSIRSRNLCLLHPTAEGWRLSVFQNEKESLYCLSHVAGMNKIKLKKQNGKWIISKDTVSAAVRKHQNALSLLKKSPLR